MNLHIRRFVSYRQAGIDVRIDDLIDIYSDDVLGQFISFLSILSFMCFNDVFCWRMNGTRI